MNALNLTAKYEDYMTGLRRWFHENPELSGKEYETIRKIDAELTVMPCRYWRRRTSTEPVPAGAKMRV